MVRRPDKTPELDRYGIAAVASTDTQIKSYSPKSVQAFSSLPVLVSLLEIIHINIGCFCVIIFFIWCVQLCGRLGSAKSRDTEVYFRQTSNVAYIAPIHELLNGNEYEI